MITHDREGKNPHSHPLRRRSSSILNSCSVIKKELSC
jgi:hypothetical protein